LETTAANVASNTIVPWDIKVDLFFNDNALWVVPLLLVILQFTMKVFVAEQASWHQTWKNFLQSPVDVGFLATSFAATLIISKTTSINSLYTTSLIYLVLAILIIVIWKISPTHTTRNSLITSAALVVLNFIISGMMLIYSVSLLTRLSK